MEGQRSLRTASLKFRLLNTRTNLSNWTKNATRERGIPRAGPTRTSAAKDHPRRCREYWRTILPMLAEQGSPPRVRGIRSKSFAASGSSRITPAGAGNTSKHFLDNVQQRDHPRGCGEYNKKIPTTRLIIGSPPRVRGIRLMKNIYHIMRRITPAGAGNTLAKPCGIRCRCITASYFL